ncbi:restriction endonuclease subunit S [Streptococcus vestibularis]|jgi:hypothetical protein|uniref:restriction endonuclease subunit S n=1 Tax=Streptococcus vestibularis TaxID=1343 RepID=UPI002000BA88|nr:restriction endonuclease subunit S [Streptococcus vestibularis]
MEKPKIRFLKNKHSWVRNTFEEIAKRRTKSSDNPDLPRIEYQDIISGEGRLNKDLNKNIDCRKGIVFETNDILYGKLRPYLKNWLHPNFNGIALGDFWVLQARNCDSKFLFSLVQSPKFQRVANDTSGTKMPRSDWKTVSQTEFSIPTSNEEQSAIGSLFRTLDDLLSSYKDNLANYQSLKATMLSKMFPKAGQSIPEIRLDGFEGEWKKDTLEPYLTESRISGDTGLTAKKITVKLWGKGVIEKEEKYAGSSNTQYFIRKAGQFIYSKLDFQNQAFGIIPNELDGYQSTLDLPTFDIQNIDPKFLLEYVMRREFYEYQGLIANGSRKAKRIHPEDFLDMPVRIPSLEEQQAIGSYFSSLDNLINSHQEKISQIETLKKKLLQDMFI